MDPYVRDVAHRCINDYGLIGNGHTAALIDRTGSLAWLCWPRFDSDACFASLLGDGQHGHWTISPIATFSSSRKYRKDTLVLETTFETENGKATLLDFMPVETGEPCIVRLLKCDLGKMSLSSAFAPAFANGRVQAELVSDAGAVVARYGVNKLQLVASRPVEPEKQFEMTAGDEIAFVLGGAPHDVLRFAQSNLSRCEDFWRAWAGKCTYEGPWREEVVRSLITLKAMIYQPTGGIVAAPTSSLPEVFGGSRNWDYRFCWLRDSTFAVLALLHAGYRDEAREWVHWLLEAIAPNQRRTQPMYGVLGSEELTEQTADWLPGFRGSRPVRFGNAAHLQHQLDIYGEVQDTLHQWRTIAGSKIESSWPTQLAMLKRLDSLRRDPDAGFWEQRSKPEHFTQSQALCWVAFDRAIRSAGQFGFEGPLNRWRQARADVHEQVCRRGFSEKLNSFTRSFGSESFDASTLLIAMVGFLPANDPRITGTIAGIGRNLVQDSFVFRYDQSRDNDGIKEGEGAFLPCCFWYADCLCLQDRTDEAAVLFEKYLGARNDLGLLAEEYDVTSKTLRGNFPQALSHLALVHTALNLTGAGPAHSRAT